MRARLIDGRAIAAELRAEVAASARRLRESQGLTPRLDVLLVGDDPASATYVRNKTRAAAEAGLTSRLWRLPAAVTQPELLEVVAGRNADPETHGILIQLPLPGQIDVSPVIEAVDPTKDVDGFHPANLGRLAAGLPGGFAPCTPQGCMRLLEHAVGRERLRGKRALVLGRSNIVGKPMALLLLAADCTVTLAHSRSEDLPSLCREADILVAATGQPAMVRGDWVREGAVVIDVGLNRVTGADGVTKLAGDVAFAEAAERAACITPVPGGVGPMTVACLLANTVEAARRQSASAER